MNNILAEGFLYNVAGPDATLEDMQVWQKVAQTINQMFPKRRVKFVVDSCKKRNLKFLKMSPNVPVKHANMLSCGSHRAEASPYNERLSGK